MPTLCYHNSPVVQPYVENVHLLPRICQMMCLRPLLGYEGVTLLVCVQVWEGKGVVKTGRVMLGATNPADSSPGTIRGDFCIDVSK